MQYIYHFHRNILYVLSLDTFKNIYFFFPHIYQIMDMKCMSITVLIILSSDSMSLVYLSSSDLFVDAGIIAYWGNKMLISCILLFGILSWALTMAGQGPSQKVNHSPPVDESDGVNLAHDSISPPQELLPGSPVQGFVAPQQPQAELPSNEVHPLLAYPVYMSEAAIEQQIIKLSFGVYEEPDYLKFAASLAISDPEVKALVAKLDGRPKLRLALDRLCASVPVMDLFWRSRTQLPTASQYELVLPFIGCLLGNGSFAKSLRPGMIKVSVIFLFLVSGVASTEMTNDIDGVRYRLINEDLFLLVSSQVTHQQVVKTEESIDLKGFSDLLGNLDTLQDTIQELNSFQQSHLNCWDINKEIRDDMSAVFDLVRNGTTNDVVIQSHDHDYNILIRLRLNKLECIMDFSEVAMNRLLLNHGKRQPSMIQHLAAYSNIPPPFTDNGKQCLKTGLLSGGNYYYEQIYKYDEQFEVGFPSHERCALTCKVKHERFQLEIMVSGNTTLNDCDHFTLSTYNHTCFIGHNKTDLRRVKARLGYKVYKDPIGLFESSSVSGGNNCLPEELVSSPMVLFEGRLVNISDLCSFGLQKFHLSDYKFKCSGLHGLLSRPIQQLRHELGTYFFHIQLASKNFKVPSVAKRTPLLGLPAIASNLLKVGSQLKPVVLGLLKSHAVSGSLKYLGKYLSGSLKLPTSFVSQKEEHISPIFNANSFDINKFLTDYAKYVNISYDMLVDNYPVYLNQLLLKKSQLINNFNQLLLLTRPLLNSTRAFLQNEDYLYTYLISSTTLTRQFIVTRTATLKNESYNSVIPISAAHFFNDSFWSTNSISGNGLSRCLVSLLRFSEDAVVRNCVDKVGKIRITANVLRVNHFFENRFSYLLVLNEKGVVEVITGQDVSLLTCGGFCILYTNRCHTINLNGELLVAADMSVQDTGILSPPQFLINKNYVLIKPSQAASIFTVDNIQTSAIMAIVLFVIFVCVGRWCGASCTGCEGNGYFGSVRKEYILLRRGERNIDENKEMATKL